MKKLETGAFLLAVQCEFFTHSLCNKYKNYINYNLVLCQRVPLVL